MENIWLRFLFRRREGRKKESTLYYVREKGKSIRKTPARGGKSRKKPRIRRKKEKESAYNLIQESNRENERTNREELKAG